MQKIYKILGNLLLSFLFIFFIYNLLYLINKDILFKLQDNISMFYEFIGLFIIYIIFGYLFMFLNKTKSIIFLLCLFVLFIILTSVSYSIKSGQVILFTVKSVLVFPSVYLSYILLSIINFKGE